MLICEICGQLLPALINRVTDAVPNGDVLLSHLPCVQFEDSHDLAVRRHHDSGFRLGILNDLDDISVPVDIDYIKRDKCILHPYIHLLRLVVQQQHALVLGHRRAVHQPDAFQEVVIGNLNPVVEFAQFGDDGHPTGVELGLCGTTGGNEEEQYKTAAPTNYSST